jgi:hypothetical protein
MVAQGVAIVLVTSTVVNMVVKEGEGEEEGEGVVSTLSPGGGEWTTMTQTLLEAMDSIALSMVDDKKNPTKTKDHFICSMYMYMYFCTCTSGYIALGVL